MAKKNVKKTIATNERKPVKVEDYGKNELKLTFEDDTVEIVDKGDYKG